MFTYAYYTSFLGCLHNLSARALSSNDFGVNLPRICMIRNISFNEKYIQNKSTLLTRKIEINFSIIADCSDARFYHGASDKIGDY